MAENPIIPDYSKPVSTLIEKISDALGGVFRPWQIRRVAHAEADAALIQARARIEVSDLEQRALIRFVQEQARNQENMEAIAERSFKYVSDSAKPEGVDEDWLAHFFDKCRLVSDDQMQELWARALAGEANLPGRYSRRSLSFMTTLGRNDAKAFAALCSFNWECMARVFTVIPNDLNNRFRPVGGLSFDLLTHLDQIGLITFEPLNGFYQDDLKPPMRVSYFGRTVMLQPTGDARCFVDVGNVLLTKVGEELATLCQPEESDEIYQ
ncbi:MAG: DUF2806 domain-containing protein, partial [Phycisphaerales bacterium JB038]